MQSRTSLAKRPTNRDLRVDPSTGDRSLILDVTGTTPDNVITAARQIGNTIYATTNAGLETVNPTTGVVTPVTTTGVATNVALYGFANAGTLLYAAGQTNIYKIDTATGAASIAGPSIGGPAINPIDLTFDSLGHLYVAATTGNSGTAVDVYSLNPATGNLTAVSTSSGTPVGTGPTFFGLSIGTSSSGTIYGINIGGGLLSIDPTTGNRTLLSQVESFPQSEAEASGLVVLSQVPEPNSMLLAALGGLALFAAPSLRQKLIETPAVAKKEGLMTWHRSKYFHHRVEAAVLFNPCVLVGSWLAAGGAAFAAPLSPGTIVVAESNQFTSSPNDSLIAVDPATGATTTISDNAIGSGPSFNFGTDGAFISYISQQSDGSLLVVDSSESVVDSFGPGPASPSVPYESRLYRVDPSTGDRTLIADSTGTTPDNAIWAARQVGNTIFATTKAGLETIDPITGAISPFTIGGPV